MDSKNWNIASKRICKYCGWDVVESDLEMLFFFIRIVGRIIEKKACYILCLKTLRINAILGNNGHFNIGKNYSKI
jgi:hypothetical protein